MKKFNILALLIIAGTLSFASCTKSDLYRPGGANSELNADGATIDNPTDPTIVVPSEDPPPPPKKPVKK
jgi:hypothetical protein